MSWLFQPSPLVVAAGGSITGTGAVSIGGPVVAASGTVTAPVFTGSGAVSFTGPAVAGSGTVSAPVFTGSGAVTFSAPTVAGSGAVTAPTFSGSGAFTIGGPVVAGSGSIVGGPITGSGAVEIGGPDLGGSGAATSLITGSGGVTIGGPTVAGVNAEPILSTTILGFYDPGLTLVVRDAGRTVKLFSVSRAVFFGGETMTLYFPEAMDPSDVQNFTFDLTGTLAETENISTASLAVSSASPALTLGTGSRAPVVGTKTVQFWLQSSDANMQPADANITLTVTTTATPSRTLQRTGIVQVRQR